MCGEHINGRKIYKFTAGSSPRVRGTLVPTGVSDETFRFIPACAGNTRAAHPVINFPPVHPRVCGEHLNFEIDDNNSLGSSPRVRGTQYFWFPLIIFPRFIPACAGNTTIIYAWKNRSPVHPRVCGEHVFQTMKRGQTFGSSPRVRGTLSDIFDKCQKFRFIPACAGNTLEFAMRFPEDRGSSPRVRGTQMHCPPQNLFVRFIPACAGNTLSVSLSLSLVPVHPRVCGEHHILK